jgi:hypothetical protein
MPKHKRRFGSYVMPVLAGERLIGPGGAADGPRRSPPPGRFPTRARWHPAYPEHG